MLLNLFRQPTQILDFMCNYSVFVKSLGFRFAVSIFTMAPKLSQKQRVPLAAREVQIIRRLKELRFRRKTKSVCFCNASALNAKCAPLLRKTQDLKIMLAMAPDSSHHG